MSAVRMEHPDLPGRVIEAHALAVPHYANSGWLVIPDRDEADRAVETPSETGPDPESDPDTDSEPATETPRRRRAPKEADEK